MIQRQSKPGGIGDVHHVDLFTQLARRLPAPYTNEFVCPACGGSNLLPAYHLTPATRPSAVFEEAARARAKRPEELSYVAHHTDDAVLSIGSQVA